MKPYVRHRARARSASRKSGPANGSCASKASAASLPWAGHQARYSIAAYDVRGRIGVRGGIGAELGSGEGFRGGVVVRVLVEIRGWGDVSVGWV